MKSKRIGVLMGGMGPERDVSLRSGEAVAAALESRGYAIQRVLVDRHIDQVLRQQPIDVAFLALHGTYGEDGCVQGLLEVMGVPYTGSGVLASALSMDKVKSKELFQLHNLATPAYYVVQRDDLSRLQEAHGSFGFPIFVKPCRSGSSVGAGKANNLEELETRCEQALQFDREALVERFVVGAEITVGVLDGRALGALEISPKSGFYDYRAKYQPGQSEYRAPRLSQTRHQGILKIAERAYQAIGASSAARVDLLVTPTANEFVLEVNTLPGMTPTSLLPKIALSAGYEYEDLCEEILHRAALNVMPPREKASVASRSEKVTSSPERSVSVLLRAQT